MKQKLFTITFVDGEQIEETALSLEQAKILAQAKRIKQGKSYAVKSWAMAERHSHYGNCEGYCENCSYQDRCHIE